MNLFVDQKATNQLSEAYKTYRAAIHQLVGLQMRNILNIGKLW
jgi:hypothetical protein